MARYRSRRSSRRSASQSAASLLALALPAPIQRIADTRLGPLLMLIAVPLMLVAGLLQVNWSNGLPTVAVDPQVAADVIQRTRDGYNNLDQQGRLGHLASDMLSGVANASQQYNYGQTTYPTTQQTTQTRGPGASFLSTQPQSQLNHYTTTPSTTYPATQSSSQTSIPWGQTSTHNTNTTYPQQPTHSQQSTYSYPSTYASPSTSSQAASSPAGYYQQAASPSDNRNLTQQQLYQQQQYQLQQQQLYEQQLRDQQYRQWLAQQQQLGAQPTSTQQHSSAGYQQQYDTYGRPVSTGYSQPTYNYAQPAAQPTRQPTTLPSTQPSIQYGQPGYNQGYLPSINPNGRY